MSTRRSTTSATRAVSLRRARDVLATAQRRAHLYDAPGDYLDGVEAVLDQLAPDWRSAGSAAHAA